MSLPSSLFGCVLMYVLFLSQRPWSAAAQLTGLNEDEERSAMSLSLPVTQAHGSRQDETDGVALSKSVDDMLLATGGCTEVEAEFVPSHTSGLETLLSQVFECAEHLHTHHMLISLAC